MKKSRTIFLLLTIVFGGCATTKTVNIPENGAIPINHWNSTTHCDSLPRIYSGVAHNACFALFAERNNAAIYNSFEVGGYILDSVASAVADTLILPYTICTQYQRGNIEVSNYGK